MAEQAGPTVTPAPTLPVPTGDEPTTASVRRSVPPTVPHERLSPDAEALIAFARIWAPYGGPPDDELFVRFGIGRSCFDERLRRIERHVRVLGIPAEDREPSKCGSHGSGHPGRERLPDS